MYTWALPVDTAVAIPAVIVRLGLDGVPGLLSLPRDGAVDPVAVGVYELIVRRVGDRWLGPVAIAAKGGKRGCDCDRQGKGSQLTEHDRPPLLGGVDACRLFG
jgi:hypothetical protein